jgi:hypothetical protein
MIYELAGDAFGKKGGENLAVSLRGSKKAREVFKPAGEDGTYFQFFNLKRSCGK